MGAINNRPRFFTGVQCVTLIVCVAVSGCGHESASAAAPDLTAPGASFRAASACRQDVLPGAIPTAPPGKAGSSRANNLATFITTVEAYPGNSTVNQARHAILSEAADPSTNFSASFALKPGAIPDSAADCPAGTATAPDRRKAGPLPVARGEFYEKRIRD